MVDDDHLVLIMLQLSLERNGFSVWLARNGQEAIEMLKEQKNRIAIVLLDVGLKGMDGLTTLAALRRIHPEVQACLLSGDVAMDERKKLMERGAAHVVAKPFLLDELANVLRLLAHGGPGNGLSAGVTSGGSNRS